MKFSKKVFAYIAMITLSLSVMLYGVFAAINATLQVSGSVSFVAHDCEGKAQVLKIEGALMQNGSPYELHVEDKTEVLWQNSPTLNFTNDIYLDDISTRDPATGEFYDEDKKIAPIKIYIRLENTSEFPVKIEAASGNLQTAGQNPTDINGFTYSYEKLELAIDGNTDNIEDDEAFVVTITPSNDIESLDLTQFALSIEIVQNIVAQ